MLVLTLSMTGAKADECKVLTATGNAEYPPYLWRKGGGGKELIGANRAIMDEVGRRLGPGYRVARCWFVGKSPRDA